MGARVRRSGLLGQRQWRSRNRQVRLLFQGGLEVCRWIVGQPVPRRLGTETRAVVR